MQSLCCLQCGNFIKIKKFSAIIERNSAIYCNNLSHHKHTFINQNNKKIFQLLAFNQKYPKNIDSLHRASLLIIINKYQNLEQFSNLILGWLIVKKTSTFQRMKYKLNGQIFVVYNHPDGAEIYNYNLI